MNISTVEKLTGLPSTAIRYYESRGLIMVKRKDNGYRSYDEESVQTLLQIRQFRELDIPLSDIHLWRDGVVTKNELIAKRLRTLDDDSQKSVTAVPSAKRSCEEITPNSHLQPMHFRRRKVQRPTSPAVRFCLALTSALPRFPHKWWHRKAVLAYRPTISITPQLLRWTAIPMPSLRMQNCSFGVLRH